LGSPETLSRKGFLVVEDKSGGGFGLKKILPNFTEYQYYVGLIDNVGESGSRLSAHTHNLRKSFYRAKNSTARVNYTSYRN